MIRRKLIFICTVLLLPFTGLSMTYENLKFELITGLSCSNLKDGLYCLTDNKGVILNLTVRKRTSSDSLINYKKHLKSNISKTVNYRSKFKKVEKVFLNNRSWIAANHYQSEYLNYSTQYYASLKGDKAYLISISYKEDQLSEKDLVSFSKSLKF